MNKIPLARPYIKKDIVLSEIEKVLESRWISGGPTIGKFEDAIKNYNNDPDGHYIAVSNCTVGLELALRAANGGNRFNPGDEVIVPSWSWVASAFAIKNLGGKPVWCDVNRYGVVEAKTVRRLVTPKTKAIMIVHQMGIPCDLTAFDLEFGAGIWCGIPIIEDAACGLGSEHKGNKIGKSNNDVVYSFHARKCLTTGEGGMIVTRDANKAEWYRSMRSFGTNISPLKRDSANFLLKEKFDKIGTNYKMSDVQAAMGLAHLQYFDEEIQMRTRAALFYDQLIMILERDGYGIHRAFKSFPMYCTRYNWQNYRVILDDCYDRDAVVDGLRKRNIGCKWDIQSIHLEPVINEIHVVLSNTENFHNHGLWIPFFAEITKDEQQCVIQALTEVLH